MTVTIGNTGDSFPSKAPSFTDIADIQQAIKNYHFGADGSLEDPFEEISGQGVAGHLLKLTEDKADLDSPTLITPVLGVATATSLNGLGLTSLTTGFSISGGTTSRTLTVPISGTLGTAAYTDTTAYLAVDGNAVSATTSTNLSGGIEYDIPIQSGVGATTFITGGTLNDVLLYDGDNGPKWGSITQAGEVENAINSQKIYVSNDSSTNADEYVVWSTTASSFTDIYSSTSLKFNPSTGNLQATKFNGLSLSSQSTGFALSGGTTSKTLSVLRSITLTGTDSTTMTFPSTSATIARTDAGQTFTGTNTFGSSSGIQIDGTTIYKPLVSGEPTSSIITKIPSSASIGYGPSTTFNFVVDGTYTNEFGDTYYYGHWIVTVPTSATSVFSSGQLVYIKDGAANLYGNITSISSGINIVITTAAGSSFYLSTSVPNYNGDIGNVVHYVTSDIQKWYAGEAQVASVGIHGEATFGSNVTSSGNIYGLSFLETGKTYHRNPGVPAFHAILSSGTTNNQVTSSQTKIIRADSVTENNGNHYNADTWKFTAPVSGYYEFYLQGRASVFSGSAPYYRMYVNGVAQEYMGVGYSTNTCSNTRIKYLSANDYVQFYFGAGSSSSATLGTTHTSFGGKLVG